MPFDEGLPHFGGGDRHDPDKIAQTAVMILDAYEALASVISAGEGVCPACTNHLVILKLVVALVETNDYEFADTFMEVLNREVAQAKERKKS